MFSVLRGFTFFTFNIYRCVCVAFPAISFIYHFALSPTSSWKTDFLRRAAVIPLLPSSRSVGRSVGSYLFKLVASRWRRIEWRSVIGQWAAGSAAVRTRIRPEFARFFQLRLVAALPTESKWHVRSRPLANLPVARPRGSSWPRRRLARAPRRPEE